MAGTSKLLFVPAAGSSDEKNAGGSPARRHAALTAVHRRRASNSMRHHPSPNLQINSTNTGSAPQSFGSTGRSSVLSSLVPTLCYCSDMPPDRTVQQFRHTQPRSLRLLLPLQNTGDRPRSSSNRLDQQPPSRVPSYPSASMLDPFFVPACELSVADGHLLHLCE
jgi:hypothetical protein